MEFTGRDNSFLPTLNSVSFLKGFRRLCCPLAVILPCEKAIPVIRVEGDDIGNEAYKSKNPFSGYFSILAYFYNA